MGEPIRLDPTTAADPAAEVRRAREAADQLQRQVLQYAKDLRVALARSREANDALARTHLETVASLASAVDVRDEVTGGHVYRVANYGVILAEVMAPELRNDPQLIYGFLLHDIGKLAVPDGVLNKEGSLNDAEYALLKTHVEHGVRFIKRVGFLRPALTIIATHHESWDGSGYPQRLTGAEIPLGARMFAICDTLDAMLHDRPYRSAMTEERALAEIERCSGTQFDPEVVTAVREHFDLFAAVPQRPPIPGLSMEAPADSTLVTSAAANPVFEALDSAMVVLGEDSRIVEANAPFRALFGLDLVPVGLSLQDIVSRTSSLFAAPDRAREEMAQLHLDLFRGRREGRLELAVTDDSDGTLGDHGRGVRTLRWYSNIVAGTGDSVAGRVIVFEEVRTAPAPNAPTGVAVELDRLAALLEADPSDPAWAQRLADARRGLDRVRGWVGSLTEGALEAAERRETWRD